MKTKLTLLLALVATATAHAEKPNLNRFKPATNAPAPHAAPSYSGGGSSHRSRSFNAGQVIGIARALLPRVMRATQQPPPRPNTVKRGSSPVMKTNKPATRDVPKPGSGIYNPSPGSRPSLPPPVSGIDHKVAAGLEAGRQIANVLQSLDSIRASNGDVREFGSVFHQPGNAGPCSNSGPSNPFEDTFTFGGNKVSNPRDSFSNAKPRDIRGDVKNSRRAGDEDASGDWNLGSNEYMHADGSRHRTSGTETQGTIQHYTPDGKYAGRSDWSTNRTGDHATTQHFDSDGQHTSTVIVERHSDGIEQKTVYRDNQEAVITRSDDSAPAKPGAQGCDRNPSEGAALGGPLGSGVANASGLLPIDLVRQFAEGKPNTGFVPIINRHSGATHVRPDNSENSRVIPSARPKPAVMTGQGLEGSNGVAGGNDIPD